MPSDDIQSSARHKQDYRIAHAELARQAGSLNESVRICNSILKQRPFDSKAWRQLALTRTAHLACMCVATKLGRAVDRGFASPADQTTLVFALRRLGRHVEAWRRAAKLASSLRDDPSVSYMVGLCLADLELYFEAEHWFAAAATLDPGSASYHEHLGIALQGQKRHAEAIIALSHAVDLAPWALNARMRLVQSLMATNQASQAVAHGEEVVRLDPNLAVGRWCYAQALLSDGRIADAVEEAKVWVKLEPGNGEASACLGSCLQMLGRSSESSAAFAKAIDIQPRQGLAYLGFVRERG